MTMKEGQNTLLGNPSLEYIIEQIYVTQSRS
jgi:hypothetical protein